MASLEQLHIDADGYTRESFAVIRRVEETERVREQKKRQEQVDPSHQ